MSASQWRIALIGIGFVVVFGLGYLLSRAGKPYSVVLLTIHKLVSLGVIAYLVVTLVQSHRMVPLSGALLFIIILASLFFVATIATGGLMSVDKEMPVFVHTLHQVTPYLTLASTAAILYLLLIRTPVLN